MSHHSRVSTDTAADHALAFGSNTDPAKRKAYWIDELGTLRTEKLWQLVDSLAKTRRTFLNRMEELFRNSEGLEQRVAKLEEQLAKKKP